MNRLKQFNWSGWLLFGLLLLAWELGARGAPKLQLYFPPLSRVVAALVASAQSGALVRQFIVTVDRFLEGFLLSAVIGIALGVVLGYFRWVHEICETLIEFLRPMPSVAIIPVAILMLGLGDSMIVAVTVYATLWPILINTVDGVRHIEQVLIQTGRTFGLSQRKILRQVILPAASPYIVTGLRIGLSIALILVTTAEMIVGSRGLGFFILDQERSMNSANMYAGVIVVAALGYALNRLFLALEARALKWRHGMIARQTS